LDKGKMEIMSINRSFLEAQVNNLLEATLDPELRALSAGATW